MIIGAHAIISSRKPEADRAFFKDVLKLTSVDVGGGWLIFGLPPSELAVHPSRRNNEHELYLMCRDIKRFVAGVKAKGIKCGPVQEPGLGPADPAQAARWRQARRLPAAPRPAQGQEEEMTGQAGYFGRGGELTQLMPEKPIRRSRSRNSRSLRKLSNWGSTARNVR
jgi:hypothetical protein